jgi:hypothetical protein
MTRDEAENLLSGQKMGTYLVRISESLSQLAIALAGKDKYVFHIKLKGLGPGFSVYEDKIKAEKTYGR